MLNAAAPYSIVALLLDVAILTLKTNRHREPLFVCNRKVFGAPLLTTADSWPYDSICSSVLIKYLSYSCCSEVVPGQSLTSCFCPDHRLARRISPARSPTQIVEPVLLFYYDNT